MNSSFQKKFTFQTKCIYSAYIYLPSEINRSHEKLTAPLRIITPERMHIS